MDSGLPVLVDQERLEVVDDPSQFDERVRKDCRSIVSAPTRWHRNLAQAMNFIETCFTGETLCFSA